MTMVPVKLITAHNDHHAKHIDGLSAMATTQNMGELASMLGLKKMCFVSKGDIAHFSTELTTANKQSPFLMHVFTCLTMIWL